MRIIPAYYNAHRVKIANITVHVGNNNTVRVYKLQEDACIEYFLDGCFEGAYFVKSGIYISEHPIFSHFNGPLLIEDTFENLIKTLVDTSLDVVIPELKKSLKITGTNLYCKDEFVILDMENGIYDISTVSGGV